MALFNSRPAKTGNVAPHKDSAFVTYGFLAGKHNNIIIPFGTGAFVLKRNKNSEAFIINKKGKKKGPAEYVAEWSELIDKNGDYGNSFLIGGVNAYRRVIPQYSQVGGREVKNKNGGKKEEVIVINFGLMKFIVSTNFNGHTSKEGNKATHIVKVIRRKRTKKKSYDYESDSLGHW